jgi:hypothetical protein
MTAFDHAATALVIFAAGVEAGRRCYVSCAAMLVAVAIYVAAPMVKR